MLNVNSLDDGPERSLDFKSGHRVLHRDEGREHVSLIIELQSCAHEKRHSRLETFRLPQIEA